ncbi:hypothetical protein Pmar_PMAR015082 [Perkinsus marinus ATCC 50983]|uniref:C3H1-type domain-containing protein n=1 Tax=Perkinsus marinus (strain ATCC 50983 / TXsc) TaxID=423536 RepID=C5KWG6_PERM5|nr:hypothetical protein Pmar_PMAR015082 [Perkinsus marinus ATCC 50983]EER11161.1 hypothetical protein Pmar_PMAR015082 [Perkinsus marinus ATCC 50983]|eukprot:XP_002779366.1 hypothetical protein Pmar_PMAR015082 [Perkinsus marinus ATCC 50983]
MASRDSSNNLLNKQGSKFGICYAFRDGICRFGKNCRFRHSSGPRKVSGESTAEAKPSGETQRKVAGKEDERASSQKSLLDLRVGLLCDRHDSKTCVVGFSF